MYEFHTVQKGTGIHPGQTFDLDYSVTRMMSLGDGDDVQLQVGLVGYGQWQTTEKSGPSVTPAEAEARYAVNALGVATNVLWAQRKVSLGIKYFKEFSNRSTFQGSSVQVSASVGF